MSARPCWTAWKSLIVFPNSSRSCELPGFLDGGRGDAESVAGDGDATVVKEVREQHEAITLLADQVLFGNPAIVELDVCLLRGAHRHLLGDVFGLVAVGIGRDDEHRVIPVGVVVLVVSGAGVERHPVRLDAVADPVLLAVDDVLVAIFLRSGLHPREIAAGVGFRHRQSRALLARRDRLDVLLALLVGAVFVGDLAAETRQLQRQRDPRVGPVELFRDREQLRQIEPPAAPLRRNVPATRSAS